MTSKERAAHFVRRLGCTTPIEASIAAQTVSELRVILGCADQNQDHALYEIELALFKEADRLESRNG